MKESDVDVEYVGPLPVGTLDALEEVSSRG